MTRWIGEGGERKVERGERPPDLVEYAKGSGGAGRRTELVEGFRRKRRSGENVHSPSPSPFSSETPHKLCSSPCTPRTLCIFSLIQCTKSGQNGI